MQNIDFYNGQGTRRSAPIYDVPDPELYSKGNSTIKDEEKSRKKAIRVLFIILAMCIISFTTGLAIGIKFAGGPKKEIIDKKTAAAMSTISNKMTNYFQGVRKRSFPKSQYPYLVKVGNQYGKVRTIEIVKYLRNKNHEVVISKGDSGMYKLYLPYKGKNEAEMSIAMLQEYKEFNIGNSLSLFER